MLPAGINQPCCPHVHMPVYAHPACGWHYVRIHQPHCPVCACFRIMSCVLQPCAHVVHASYQSAAAPPCARTVSVDQRRPSFCLCRTPCQLPSVGVMSRSLAFARNCLLSIRHRVSCDLSGMGPCSCGAQPNGTSTMHERIYCCVCGCDVCALCLLTG
jgi:hypothetical protein